MGVDIFEHIKIMAMSDAEKIALMNHGPEYLKIFSKDDSFAIRIRAKQQIKESKDAQSIRFMDDVIDLKKQAKSTVFGTRIRAKIILGKLRDEGKIQ